MNLWQNLLLLIGIVVSTGGAFDESFTVMAAGGLVATAPVGVRTIELLRATIEERMAAARFFEDLQREARDARNRASH